MLKGDGGFDKINNRFLKSRIPDARIFVTDCVDEFNSKIHVDAFVAQNILNLFTCSGNPVLPAEGKHRHKTAVKKDTFRNRIKTYKVLCEFPQAFNGF